MQDKSSTDEIIHGHDDYTTEELLEQCQDNAASMLLATLSVLAERGIAVDEWAEGVACVFARAWTSDDAWHAGQFLDALLTNLRSLGATVDSVDLAADEPNAEISDYPNAPLAGALQVDEQYGEAMLHVGVHLARLLGLQLIWERTEDRITLRVRGDANADVAP